jgi:hypothetical protein
LEDFCVVQLKVVTVSIDGQSPIGGFLLYPKGALLDHGTRNAPSFHLLPINKIFWRNIPPEHQAGLADRGQ